MRRMFAAMTLFLAFCFLFAPVAWADQKQPTIDLSGLTAEQKALIAQQVSNLKERGTVEKVNEYVQLANNISTVITQVAGNVGVAADKFLDSTSGKITVGLIFWKVAGKDLISRATSMLVGTVMFLVFLPLWVFFFRRMCLIKEIKKEYPKEGAFKVIKTITHYDISDTDVQNTRWAMLGILVAGLLLNLWVFLG